MIITNTIIYIITIIIIMGVFVLPSSTLAAGVRVAGWEEGLREKGGTYTGHIKHIYTTGTTGTTGTPGTLSTSGTSGTTSGTHCVRT